jgi:hypothetical protein
MFGALGWTQSGANYLNPDRREIIGTAHYQMESSMAGTKDQARPETEPAQASIAAGRPETLAGVPQVHKGEVHQLDMRRGLQFEVTEHPAMQA